jgi:hypothetical protein
VFDQNDVVPTNTESAWYKELRTLGTEECKLAFYQSVDQEWVRIIINFQLPILRHTEGKYSFIDYNVLDLKPTSIISLYNALRHNIIYLSELTPYQAVPEDLLPKLYKLVVMIFSRLTIENQYKIIKSDIEQMLGKISEEVALIKQDNLARGKLIQSTSIYALKEKTSKGQERWDLETAKLTTPVSESEPPEYWGKLGFNAPPDFIASAQQYPWMPQDVSEWDFS